MKDLMRRLLCFYMGGVLIVAITGCASHSILDGFSDTVIFANVYDSVKKVTQTRYQHTSGGLLRDVLERNLANRGEAGVIKYFDGVFAYVDREFYDQLYEMEFPLSELSFYEKQLMGVVERGKRTIIPGLGTIPQRALPQ